jgi:hypothetical protein
LGAAGWMGGAAVLALAALVGAGCTDLRPGATSVLDLFSTGPTPQEAAEWAVDKYDPDKRYRGTLALSNAYFGSEPLYVELYVKNASDPDPGVRAVAIRALGNHGGPEHVPLILEGLSETNRNLRLESMRALQRIHEPSVVGSLIERLDPANEADAEVRAESATALGQYAENRVVEALISAMEDSSLAVNRAALSSLRVLTGQDFGFDMRAWIDWDKATRDRFAARGTYQYPVFQRDETFLETVIPFLPRPPNEPAASPVGMPPVSAVPTSTAPAPAASPR